MSKLKPTQSKTKEESITYTEKATRLPLPHSPLQQPSQAYNNSTKGDEELTDQMSNLTLLEAKTSLSLSTSSSSSSSSSYSSNSKTTAMNISNQQQQQLVESELVDLIDDLSVSFKQAPFMPYCL